jgi:hypothetical protein
MKTVETRWEEAILRKHCFKNDTNNLAEIKIKKNGIYVKFIEPCGYEDALSQIIGAPCSQSSFTIPFERNKSDVEIENDLYIDYMEEQQRIEQEYEDELEMEMDELYESGFCDDDGL